MINSALLLRRGEEAYATLDICHVNLFDGHAEFIKLGAVASVYLAERPHHLSACGGLCLQASSSR